MKTSETILEYVVRSLNGSALTYRQLAQKTGVPRRTLEKIGVGTSPNPRIKTVQPVYYFFLREEAREARKGTN